MSKLTNILKILQYAPLMLDLYQRATGKRHSDPGCSDKDRECEAKWKDNVSKRMDDLGSELKALRTHVQKIESSFYLLQTLVYLSLCAGIIGLGLALLALFLK